MPNQPDGEAAGLVTRLKQRWTRLLAEHPGLAHTVAAYQRLSKHNGSLYAAAITFLSFLALFPLLLLVAAVTGFVLHAHPAAQASLIHSITDQVPGSVGTSLGKSIDGVIDARTGVGILGLAGVLVTGLGWIGNLRAAVDAVWGHQQVKRNLLMQRVVNLGVLGGLGFALLVSIGLTAVGTSLSDQVLSAIGASDSGALHWVVKIAGIAIAVLSDLAIFWWVLVRLPDTKLEVPTLLGLRAAVMAAIGFELLKILGTYTIAKSSGSATAGPFAGILAVLVWIQLVARWLLFCSAWLAIGVEDGLGLTEDVDEIVVVEADVAAGDAHASEPALSPAAVGATLVGVGAVAGAAAATLAGRHRTRSRD